MKLTLLAHAGVVVVCPDTVVADSTWVPSGNRGPYCYLWSTLHDTRAHLCASREALDILAQMPRSSAPVGDWNWSRVAGGAFACTWFGALFRILDPKRDVVASTSGIHECVIVPNDISPTLAAEVDAAIGANSSFYREPVDISDTEIQN